MPFVGFIIQFRFYTETTSSACRNYFHWFLLDVYKHGIITWQAVVLIDLSNLHFDRKLNLISLRNGTASWMAVTNNLGEEGAAVIHFYPKIVRDNNFPLW